MIKNRKNLNIGFISTRIAGTDGVSLEIEKWAEVLERMGHRSFYCSGENDRPGELCLQVDEAHFKHPEILALNGALFGSTSRPASVSEKVDNLKASLKVDIKRFVDMFDIDLLVPENTLSIPMNIPLGLAITEYIAETGIPALAHHHDFFWERDRFTINAAGDYLGAAFPPSLNSIRHVVINSVAAASLAYRKGLPSTVIPNACDFYRKPEMGPESVRQAIRSLAGIAPETRSSFSPRVSYPGSGLKEALIWSDSWVCPSRAW